MHLSFEHAHIHMIASLSISPPPLFAAFNRRAPEKDRALIFAEPRPGHDHHRYAAWRSGFFPMRAGLSAPGHFLMPLEDTDGLYFPFEMMPPDHRFCLRLLKPRQCRGQLTFHAKYVISHYSQPIALASATFEYSPPTFAAGVLFINALRHLIYWLPPGNEPAS